MTVNESHNSTNVNIKTNERLILKLILTTQVAKFIGFIQIPVYKSRIQLYRNLKKFCTVQLFTKILIFSDNCFRKLKFKFNQSFDNYSFLMCGGGGGGG